MKQIPFYRSPPLECSVHYKEDSQACIKALKSVYANNEVPLGNASLSRQRSFGNVAVWDSWFYGCPHVQGKVDGAGLILFDDRVVDVNNLNDHPLLNPSYLRDHWKEMQNGAIPAPREYVSALIELSRVPNSGVRALAHKDLRKINTPMSVAKARANPYFIAFTGLEEAERGEYLKAHKAKWGKTIGLYCHLKDAEREQAMGRWSVFNDDYNLGGLGNLGGNGARLFGVQASVASSSAEEAAKAELTLDRFFLDEMVMAILPEIEESGLREYLRKNYK